MAATRPAISVYGVRLAMNPSEVAIVASRPPSLLDRTRLSLPQSLSLVLCEGSQAMSRRPHRLRRLRRYRMGRCRQMPYNRTVRSSISDEVRRPTESMILNPANFRLSSRLKQFPLRLGYRTPLPHITMGSRPRNQDGMPPQVKPGLRMHRTHRLSVRLPPLHSR